MVIVPQRSGETCFSTRLRHPHSAARLSVPDLQHLLNRCNPADRLLRELANPVYDMVNTPMADQMTAHNQLLNFVDHAQPGTRMALFVNAAGLHMVQGFTSDHALLHAAILSKGPGPHVPDVFMYGSNYGYSDAGASLQCLKFIADYVNGIPGRKNLFWLSSVFPIPVGPSITNGLDVNAGAGPGGGFSNSTMQINDLTYLLSENIKKTYSALMRSQVSLYPVNIEGQNIDNYAGDQITHEPVRRCHCGSHRRSRVSRE